MGRARRFDESNLLAAATELFWSNGYDNTSVEDVSVATGVGNGSIYAAYGNKKGLFLAAFDRYCEARAQFVRTTIESAPGTARTAVRTLLKAVVDDCAAQPHRRGCLMINSVAHLATRIPEVATTAARTTAAMESAVATRLRPAARDLTEAELSALSANIVLVSQGLIQLSRLNTPPARLAATAEVTCASLPAWADR
ncbi:TetR/AcrR family transcriptional regulator [Nocardia sp. NBC_01503]|uniref:TetR/AcrR family transcriptional regulator n=1 Tax=Nocardia sp. NBC_01503 TaxID=2975997 RepID=UPI002E7B50E3|nr:TetR/AcrR family transcriptional regulator [Nocardia sp. NBC_01503]WTL30782.1 TetR/AcrR family transcriptional regulator [Nocardia sp. NBC_01503]